MTPRPRNTAKVGQSGNCPQISTARVCSTATVSGFYDDPKKLVEDAAGIDAPGTYITLNPVDSRLLARRKNRLKQLGKKDASASDKDIVRRAWLFIEIDPTRPLSVHLPTVLRRLGIRPSDLVCIATIDDTGAMRLFGLSPLFLLCLSYGLGPLGIPHM